MAGVVVGDALGFPLEGGRTVPGRYLEETVPALRRLDYSDDTALTIALAESLVQCGGLDGMDMAQRFAATWAHAPDRGYGGNVVKVFRSVLSGVDWKEAAPVRRGRFLRQRRSDARDAGRSLGIPGPGRDSS